MTRRLVPFLAALAAGKPVTFDRTNDQATIDGVNYSTSDPPPLPRLTVRRKFGLSRVGITEGESAEFIITASRRPSSSITVNFRITQTGGPFVSSTYIGTQRAIMSRFSQTITWVIPTIVDRVEEETGSVTLTLLNGVGYAPPHDSATILIFDND